jgi:Tol biopolymer transport system component
MSSFFSAVTKIFLLLAACFFVVQSHAQEAIVNENNAPSLKWYQLNTTHFRILYPLGYEQQAQRMANTLEYIHEPEAKTMGASPRKISIILQNQNSISNGFVSITPRRSEFFGMPSQNYNFTGNNDWLNLLATHEYRHIVQFQHATRGFNRLVYYGFGNFGLSAMAYLGAPQWFWEGDAVATETAFTNSGRGRIPNFELLFRTNLMEGRTFNYHKQYLRSYKHNIPDHYKLGYHMVSYLRRKTKNPEVWENVTRRSWNTSFVPFTFSVALKKETGLYVRDLYNEMAADLKKQWQAQLDTTRITSFFTVNARTNNAYTDYRFPQEMEGGRILVQKSGIGDIEQLVLLDGNHETTIYTQGAINDAAMLSATNSRVVWNEHRFDPRWRMKTYSAIVGYDMGSKTKTVIAKNGRYAAAAISSDGYQIATVETSTDYQTKLVVLDYLSGNRVLEFKNPDNDFISMPRWTPDGKQIVALKTNKKGKALVSFIIETKEEKLLTEFSDENMGHPVPFGKYVLYNSPISGIDNIYALDTETGKRYQITSSKYGSYNPSLSRDGKIIYYNEQGKDGMDVVKTSFNPSEWKEWNLRIQPSALFAHLAEQEASHHFLTGIPDSTYKSKRYSRLKGIVNPYTWGAYVNNDLTSIFAGITSRDLLSTTTISGGYQYDIAEQTSAWKGGVSFQAWYPIIDFSFTQSDRKINEGEIETISYTGTRPNYTETIKTQNLTFNWSEKTIEGGLRIPLVTTSSKFVSSVSFGNAVGVTQVSNFSNSINKSRIIPAVTVNDTILSYYFFSDRINNGNLVYNHFSFSAYRLLKQSRRDINSKWGQAIYMNAYGTPYGGNYTGSQFSVYGIAYFPSILSLFDKELFKHHSLWGYAGYQSTQINSLRYANQSGTEIRDNAIYQFTNRIPLPRGHSLPRFADFFSFSGNYTMPVWYPDLNIGPLLNIQRVRVNGFFDYGYGSTPLYGLSRTYMSTGAEVKFDINVMRLLPQLDIGFRYSYGIKPSTTLFEILIGTFNF